MSSLLPQLTKLASKIIKYSTPKLKIFWKYAQVELVPPSPGEIPEVVRHINKLIAGAKANRWKQVTVREAWLNTLVTMEVLCWFYVGECIGKRHLVGYDV